VERDPLSGELLTARPCPFCDRVLPDPTAHRHASTHSVAFLDAFPSAPGHTLIIPRRHVALIADLTEEEHEDLFGLLRSVVGSMRDIGARSIGINDGTLAGQTVPHVHVHVIPRRSGDVGDPRGGIRWVLPGTAAYWEPSKQG
jgi:diadenosine tetraphosphate (Ap4A) HIT family hydrolase